MKDRITEELSKSWRKPNTDTILCGEKLAVKINKVLKEYEKSKI